MQVRPSEPGRQSLLLLLLLCLKYRFQHLLGCHAARGG